MLQFYQQLAYGDIDEQYLWEQRLQPQLGYLSEEHRTKVREALSLGYDAHINQKRKSGEPFITHPVEVTRILAELQMDYESLIAGEPSLVILLVVSQWFIDDLIAQCACQTSTVLSLQAMTKDY